ncbi:hypothetical protein PVAND_014776 [Polypedilum vanderplanki]|uniref:Bulb-type lectin domain-containing protein n=1 Tax=Polypedilum vanderplanki TaxID=319348 RepID=A0A9J6BAZ5_POLVA|nr:hypothetical protein PVAND_014776 [Polypedilum vanderplanki]
MLLKKIFVITVLISIFIKAKCMVIINQTIETAKDKDGNELYFLPGDKLAINECLLNESWAIKSNGGKFYMRMHMDGNLVIYITKEHRFFWSTNTDNTGGKRLCMQEDGDFNIYGLENNVLWSSNTKGKYGIFVILTNCGYLEMYAEYNIKLWENKEYPAPHPKEDEDN